MAKYTRDETQDWAWENLNGQWSTAITPFTADGELDETGLKENIHRIRSLGTRGIGCSWGMGEFWSLTIEERHRVYDIVSEEVDGQWMTAAHVTHTSINDMLALSDHAHAVGFDLLIIAPCYMVTKTEKQVLEWVNALARHTSMAIMFYNSPQFGIVMSVEGLRSICEIPNVVGVKEASFNRQLSIDAHMNIGDEYIISTPDEWAIFKGEEMGFRQQVMFANTSDWRFDTPGSNYYVQFIDRATNGDVDVSFYEKHIRPIKEVSDKWWQSTVKNSGGVLPVALCKYWGELMGMAGGPVRLPLLELSLEEKQSLKADIEMVRDTTLPIKGDPL